MASDLALRIGLFLVVLNILLGVKFATTNEDCGSVFETQVDNALFGHVMKSTAVRDEFECLLKCSGNSRCLSANVHPGTNNGESLCELINETRVTKPDDFKRKKGSNYYGSVKTSCVDLSRNKYKQRSGEHCSPGYRGNRCQTPRVGWHSHHPAQSCKDIRDKGDSRGDGKYWIDPERKRNPLKVYCDMTTDGGGWLLISNVVLQSSSCPHQLPVKTSYCGISSDQMVLTKDAMTELRTKLSFTQLRFHCNKKNGRTFHVTTADNSFGEAVVQYLSGQTDVQPNSCGSFVRMENDNSELGRVCERWGRVNGTYNVGKWGAGFDQDRLFNHAAFVGYAYHWALPPTRGNRCECDDFGGRVSSGDFWKIYVR